ncbi:MAG: hypothetical protein L0H84_21905 [Pseudonocardia sp.]|nr:hypothetical protein [Pseudonocardia sp.]
MVIDPEAIDWDEVNREHATRHGISVTEINQALRNDPTVRRTRKGRRGDYYAFGITDGGRKVVVVIAWNPDRRIIRPITAWEQR